MFSLLFTTLALFPAADDRAINDAPLYCVRFVDKNEGWAGGADGVMWHTIDGGNTWERQPLPTKGTIHALQFLTPYTGYAAGGEEFQATGTSSAVLLATRDGGLTWNRISTGKLPGLKAVSFTDDFAGAVTTSGGSHFQTTNAGRTWTSLRDVAIVDDGGVALPQDYRPIFTMHGSCRNGNHVRIVGSPGTMVFQSSDGGKNGGNNWATQPTGQTIPLNSVHFLDERTGWAVGELGTILATTDGGAIWKAQQRGGQRAAVMCIHTRDANIPLDLVASLGAGEGYLIHCLTVLSSEDNANRKLRVATAIRKAGGAVADSVGGFVAPPNIESMTSDQLRTHWNQLASDVAMDRLTKQLVLHLRTWQPEVVICDFAGGPAETLVVEAVQAAVKQAADPKAFPEQLQVGKLATWQVKKLFGLWDGPGAPHITVRTDDVSPVLGESPRDHANRVVGLIAESASLPKSRGLRLLAHNMPNGAGLNGIMDGIVLAPNGTARRPSPEAKPEDKDPNEKHARELRNLVTVAQSGLPQVGDPAAVLANMGRALDKLPAEQGLKTLLAMADQSAKSGNWPLAKETYELAVNRYDGQPANIDAIRWLMRYYSSSEARRMYDSKQSATVTRTDFAASANKRPLFDPNDSVQPLTNPAINLTQTTVSDPASARKWCQGALALEPRLAALGPAASNDPSILLPLAAVKRQLGESDAGKSQLRKLLADPTTPEPWRTAARQELWFADRRGPAPRIAATCVKASKRPHLDAIFDDECWRDVPAFAVPLSEELAGYATTARFAFDDEFLYVALECQHPESAFRPKVEHRERDANVTPFDHVELVLDMDRDYATYYRLCIDQRGALAEDCTGNPKWNPRWYVAFQSTNEGFTAEFAVHLSDMTNEPLVNGKAWAMNLLRVVPGKGANNPTVRPEECGLLIFADPKQ